MVVIEDIGNGQSPVVTLTGTVDSAGSGRVNEVLSGLLESGCLSTMVDLAGVSFIDAAGLETVIRWRQNFHENRSEFHVISVNPAVRRVFEVAGHSHIVDGSEERLPPPVEDGRPIVECSASGEDWEACSFSVPGRVESCKVVRDRIDRMMADRPFTQEDRGNVKMAVGEAISNAIRHGCRECASETVTVQCLATVNRVVVEITDKGPGFDPDTYMMPPPDELPEHGMGIRFMQRCVDDVSFRIAGGTTARLVKHVQPQHPRCPFP